MRFIICLILLSLFLTQGAYASGDFFILDPREMTFVRTPGQKLFSLNSTACRDRIRQILCLVNPQKSPGETRECLPNSESFAIPLEKIHDILPSKLQKVFCSLDVIFVENEMETLAYAGIMREDPKKGILGAFLGVNKLLLQKAQDAASVLGWKEQKAFGIKAPRFKQIPEGPSVEVQIPTPQAALQYLIIHEFAHILDFTNLANNFVCPSGETCDLEKWEPNEVRKLVPVQKSWSALSWKNPMAPKKEFHFPLWDSLCFYGCSKSLSVEDIEQFYRELDPTNFVTTYAAVSPYEDFAESFTFYVLNLQDSWSYDVQTSEATYSLTHKWNMLSDKKSWIENFYNRDLRYPTPSK